MENNTDDLTSNLSKTKQTEKRRNNVKKSERNAHTNETQGKQRKTKKSVSNAKTENSSDKISRMSKKIDNRRICSDGEAQSGKVLKRKTGKHSGEKGNIPTTESRSRTASSKACKTVCEIPASEKQPEISMFKTLGKSDCSSSGTQKGTLSGAVSKKSKKSSTISATENKKMLISKKVNLRPSDIRFSQSSISSLFKDGTNIGQLLDDIYFGRCFASALPQIEVSYIEGQWVSADNRRLWVFTQLEKVGRIDFITVKVVKKLYEGKLTSVNNGLDVDIRNGEPKGIIYSLLYPDTKKTKSRRKRRTETGRNIKTDLDQGQSDLGLEMLGDFSSCIPSDESYYNSTEQLESILQYNQSFVDENTYFEMYSYSDEDWAEEDCNSDTLCFPEYSQFQNHDYWHGSKNENKIYFPDEDFKSSTISFEEPLNTIRSACSFTPPPEERVKTISTENNFLTKIADGVDIFVGFLNRLFT